MAIKGEGLDVDYLCLRSKPSWVSFYDDLAAATVDASRNRESWVTLSCAESHVESDADTDGGGTSAQSESDEEAGRGDTDVSQADGRRRHGRDRADQQERRRWREAFRDQLLRVAG